MTTLAAHPVTSPPRPSALRRTALAATGVLACALPTVWGVGVTVELLTGTERDHLFHQLTGQGLMLSALWLGGLLPLLSAGWRGVRPSAAAALGHLAVVAGAVVAALLASGAAGGAFVAAVALVTGGLVWLALPLRPRVPVSGLDPVLAPVALAVTAVLTSFVMGQAALQRTSTDEHAEFAHYFDMAWISAALIVLAAAAAVVPAARRLALVAGLGTAYIGIARFLITPDVTWSLTAVGVGLLGAGAVAARLARRVG